MMSRRWRHWLPWRCLLLAAAIALGLCVAWSGWRHWLLAEQHHAQVGEQLARQRQALAALTQRQGQLAHEQPLWRALRQRGWLATENRLRALEALQALRQRPGVRRISARLGPRRPLDWPWPPPSPLQHSALTVHWRLTQIAQLPGVLAPLADLPGLMLPSACQWRRWSTEDASVEGECGLMWVTEQEAPGEAQVPSAEAFGAEAPR